jgi:hypothetical protein
MTTTSFTDNTTLTGEQRDGVIAATASDQFFAVWTDRNLTPDHIIARSFDSLGNPLTGEVDITPLFAVDALNPAAVRLPIAGQADGLAVAIETVFSGTDHDIYLVRTNSALNLLENFIPIDTSGFFEEDPSITSFSDGSLWVSYTRFNSDFTDSDILARRVDSAGNVSAVINIFTDAANTLADHSDLATLKNGNVVAVFETGPFNEGDVFFTIRQPDGTIVVDTTGVNGATDPISGIAERDAHVAALANGGFVVTWTDEAGDQGGINGGDSNGIRASIYNANGNLVQGDILVNVFNQAGGQFFSDVTALPDGGFIVAFEDDNPGGATPVERAQRFDDAGNLVGTPFTFGDLSNLDFNGDFHTNAATFSDGRAILTLNVGNSGIPDLDVVTWIVDFTTTQAGGAGNDTLVAVKGQDNLIYGDPIGQPGGQFQGGNDTLIGGAAANNTLVGDTNVMVGTATGGNDTLIGGKGGTNTLIGDAQEAGGGRPTGGNDILVGAANTPDDMWGDFQSVTAGQPIGGQDRFVFGPKNGDDIIHDFSRVELDKIVIDASKAPGNFPHTFPELEPNIEVVGSDSIIHFDAHNSVTVLNFVGLIESDFLFLV